MCIYTSTYVCRKRAAFTVTAGRWKLRGGLGGGDPWRECRGKKQEGIVFRFSSSLDDLRLSSVQFEWRWRYSEAECVDIDAQEGQCGRWRFWLPTSRGARSWPGPGQLQLEMLPHAEAYPR